MKRASIWEQSHCSSSIRSGMGVEKRLNGSISIFAKQGVKIIIFELFFFTHSSNKIQLKKKRLSGRRITA